jgi:hypothetical protein
MVHRTLALFGLVEALAPRRLVALGERLAFRDRGESELRSWVVPAARLEGLLWVLLARRGSSSTLRSLLTVIGLPALLAPEQFLHTGLRLAYENSDRIEPRPWVVPATRLVGLAYVLVGFRSWLGRGSSTASAEATVES